MQVLCALFNVPEFLLGYGKAQMVLGCHDGGVGVKVYNGLPLFGA